MDIAWCSGCKSNKKVTEFAKNKSRKNGLQARCNDCRQRYNGSPEARRRSKDRVLRSKFNITLVEYETMLKAQGGRCAICKQPEQALSNVSGIKLLAVDHCHDTGRVRKLLCHRCNVGIGYLSTPELLKAAYKYLKNETVTAIV